MTSSIFCFEQTLGNVCCSLALCCKAGQLSWVALCYTKHICIICYSYNKTVALCYSITYLYNMLQCNNKTMALGYSYSETTQTMSLFHHRRISEQLQPLICWQCREKSNMIVNCLTKTEGKSPKKGFQFRSCAWTYIKLVVGFQWFHLDCLVAAFGCSGTTVMIVVAMARGKQRLSRN